MAADAILFLDDKAHAWNEGVTIVASSTAEGDAENVRDTSYGNWWKPSDGTSDEYLQIDGPSQTWLGTVAGDDIYCAIAYDATACDQTIVQIISETSEGSGTWISSTLSFSLNPLAPTCDIKPFNLVSGGRTRYRLYQYNSQRGGGTRTARIYSWGLYPVGGYFDVEANLNAMVSPHATNWAANTGVVHSPAGFPFTQRRAAMGQDFKLNIRRTKNETAWSSLVDAFQIIGGSARNFYMQFEGLKNAALANFAMVRISGERWSASRPYIDNLEISIPIETEAHQ